MVKKITKKVISKKKLVDDKDKPATLKHLESLRKDLKSEMVVMSEDIKKYVDKVVREVTEESYRGFQVVYEDTNDRIAVVGEIFTENRRTLDRLDKVTDTVYHNHAPRIA
jgi:hypothetical protein